MVEPQWGSVAGLTGLTGYGTPLGFCLISCPFSQGRLLRRQPWASLRNPVGVQATTKNLTALGARGGAESWADVQGPENRFKFRLNSSAKIGGHAERSEASRKGQ